MTSRLDSRWALTRRIGAAGWDLSWLVLPVIATAYAALVLLASDRILGYLLWNTDLAASPVLGSLLRSAPNGGSLSGIGNPGYLQLDLLVAGLPGYRVVTALIQPALCLVGIGAAGVAVWRLSGVKSALVTVTLLVAVSPSVLLTYLPQAVHGSTWMGQCLVFAVGTFLLTTDREKHKRRSAALCLGTAAVVGYWSLSDPLLLVDGVFPAVVSVVVVAIWARRQGVVVRANLVAFGSTLAATCLLMAITGLVLLHGYTWTRAGVAPGPLRFATATEVAGNASLFVRSALSVGGGDFLGARVVPWGPLLLSSAIAGVVGSLCPWLLMRRTLRESPGRLSPARLFAATYWAAVQAIIIGAFLFSQVPVDISATRYLPPLVLAAACTAPILARRGSGERLALLAGAAIVAANNLVVVAQFTSSLDADPRASALTEIAQSLQARGLDRGYAPYWDSYGVTWHTGGDVVILPVADTICGQPEGVFCPSTIFSASELYRPRDGASFYVYDPATKGGYWAGRPDPAVFGEPATTYAVGDATVYVYGYDIASRFVLP